PPLLLRLHPTHKEAGRFGLGHGNRVHGAPRVWGGGGRIPVEPPSLHAIGSGPARKQAEGGTLPIAPVRTRVRWTVRSPGGACPNAPACVQRGGVMAVPCRGTWREKGGGRGHRWEGQARGPRGCGAAQEEGAGARSHFLHPPHLRVNPLPPPQGVILRTIGCAQGWHAQRGGTLNPLPARATPVHNHLHTGSLGARCMPPWVRALHLFPNTPFCAECGKGGGTQGGDGGAECRGETGGRGAGGDGGGSTGRRPGGGGERREETGRGAGRRRRGWGSGGDGGRREETGGRGTQGGDRGKGRREKTRGRGAGRRWVGAQEETGGEGECREETGGRAQGGGAQGGDGGGAQGGDQAGRREETGEGRREEMGETVVGAAPVGGGAVRAR
ncbi:hypothetical protein EI94DRAFT_1848320, partial [Lactarius quietus]